MFALVDPDPHGIEIYLTYKHGSIEMAREAASLTAPELKLLGVLPSEVSCAAPLCSEALRDSLLR
jgi:meiotic recombination protein SPO11